MTLFIGPSYALASRKASAQRCVNMYLVPMETAAKSQFILQSVPGLVYAGKLGSASWPTDPYNCRIGWYHWINNNNGAGGRWDNPGSSRAMHSHGYRLIRDALAEYDETAIRALLAPRLQLNT